MKMKTYLSTLTLCGVAFTLAFTGSVADAGLVLHSTMDDADIVGTTVLDLTAPAENGTLAGSGVTTGAAGQIGQAIDATIAGSAAAVGYGDVLDTGAGVQTISLWFNADTLKTQFLARKGNAGSGDVGWSMFLELRSGGFHRVVFRANAVGGSTSAARAIALMDLSPGDSTGAWHHLAMVLDGGAGTITGYIDGTNSGLATNPWGTTFSTTGVGLTSGSSLLAGLGADAKIDDFAIFDEALSAGDIQDIYTNGLAGIAVPEPATAGLLLAGLAMFTRRSSRA